MRKVPVLAGQSLPAFAKHVEITLTHSLPILTILPRRHKPESGRVCPVVEAEAFPDSKLFWRDGGMYSLVMMAALSTGTNAPAHWFSHGCHGCFGCNGCYGSCYGCWGSCHGCWSISLGCRGG